MLSTLRSTAKNSIIYGIGNLSTKIIGLILLPFYTRVFPVGEFGRLAMLETTSQILITVFGLSLYGAFIRWYWEKDYQESQKSLFFTVLIFLTSVSALMVVALTGSSRLIASVLLDNPSYSRIIILMAITAGFEIIAVLPLTLMRIQERPGMFITANILKFTFNLSLTIIFIAGFKHGLEGVYEAQIIGNIVFFIFLSKYIINHIELRFHLKGLKEMLAFSMPLVFASIATIFLNLTDRYSIKFINGLEELGSYQFGFKIANAIRVIVINSVSFALTPVIYRMINEKGSKRFYSKILTYMGFGIMVIVMVISSYGKEISMIFAQKKEYLNAYKFIPVLAFGLFFSSLKDTVFTGLNITKKTKISALIIVVVSVVNLVLNIIFISVLRSMGAAVATLISQIIYLMLVYKYSQKYFYIPYEWIKIIKILTTGAALTIISLLANNLPLLPGIFVKLVILSSYPFILYFWNFYEKIELQHLDGFRNKYKSPGKLLNKIKSSIKGRQDDQITQDPGEQ